MKSAMKPQKRKNHLHVLIQGTTGAPDSDIAIIENIMRDDIFHSTLDWQTSEQLSYAARQAFDLLNENRDMYEFSHTSAMAAFNEMRAAEASR